MNTELSKLQNRYDELLVIENKSDAEWTEILDTERRIEQILFPVPRREDFNDEEWAVASTEYEISRKAYDDANDAKYAAVNAKYAVVPAVMALSMIVASPIEAWK